MNTTSFIAPELLADFSAQAEKVVSVLITCDENNEAVVTTIKQAGINIEDHIKELNIIKATITKDELIKLQALSGITWIEADEDVTAF